MSNVFFVLGPNLFTGVVCVSLPDYLSSKLTSQQIHTGK